MGDGSDNKYLKKFRFKNKHAFEKHVQQTIEDLEFAAQRIFYLFRNKVEEWEKAYLNSNKGKERFVAETITPPQDKLIKGPERIAQKIIDSWIEHDEWREKGSQVEAPQKHDPKGFLSTMTDVIRFRIVCNYLSDVEYIDKRLKSFVDRSGDLKIKSRNDHIETPFPTRRAGHRAVQYVLEYCKSEPPILFEVQIMTQLQHAWDKKDHHLIYEYVRLKQDGKIPLYLKNRMAAMSEMLYIADAAFDSLKEEITKIMEKKKK